MGRNLLLLCNKSLHDNIMMNIQGDDKMLFLEHEVELTDTEFDIYNYISANIESVIYMRVRELAEVVHYSTTTILRFCRKFNCAGFAEFRVKLRLFHDTQDTILVDRADESTYIDFLQRTTQATYQDGINQGVEIVKEAEMVIFLGVGASKVMAQYGAMYFSSLFLLSLHIEDLMNHPLGYLSETLTHKSCLVILSVDGENQELIRTIHQMKSKNVKIISITNSSNSTIAKLSDVNLAYYINKEQYGEANITSQLPALYTIERIGKQVRYELNQIKKEQLTKS